MRRRTWSHEKLCRCCSRWFSSSRPRVGWLWIWSLIVLNCEPRHCIPVNGGVVDGFFWSELLSHFAREGLCRAENRWWGPIVERMMIRVANLIGRKCSSLCGNIASRELKLTFRAQTKVNLYCTGNWNICLVAYDGSAHGYASITSFVFDVPLLCMT